MASLARDAVETLQPASRAGPVLPGEVVRPFLHRYRKHEAEMDVAILETGIGGRLDATNAIQSDVSVITQIDFDHKEWLGNTLAEIASEKAGIIKPRIPVVAAAQRAEAEKVIRAQAADCEARLQFVTRSYDGSPIALRGHHQKQNAILKTQRQTDHGWISFGLLLGPRHIAT